MPGVIIKHVNKHKLIFKVKLTKIKQWKKKMLKELEVKK